MTNEPQSEKLLEALREQAWKDGVAVGRDVDVAGGPIPRKPVIAFLTGALVSVRLDCRWQSFRLRSGICLRRGTLLTVGQDREAPVLCAYLRRGSRNLSFGGIAKSSRRVVEPD